MNNRFDKAARSAVQATRRNRRIRKVKIDGGSEPVIIEKKEKSTVPKHFLSSIKDEDRVCAICTDLVDDDPELTPCFHLYHSKCLADWKVHKLECPRCKSGL